MSCSRPIDCGCGDSDVATPDEQPEDESDFADEKVQHEAERLIIDVSGDPTNAFSDFAEDGSKGAALTTAVVGVGDHGTDFTGPRATTYFVPAEFFGRLRGCC